VYRDAFEMWRDLNDYFTANLLLSVPLTEHWKAVDFWQRFYKKNLMASYFWATLYVWSLCAQIYVEILIWNGQLFQSSFATDTQRHLRQTRSARLDTASDAVIWSEWT